MTVSTRSVAVVPGGKFAAEFEADHLGGEHVERLAEHDGLGLDAADAPAQHAQAVDHRGMAIGAHERIGKRDRVRASSLPRNTPLARYSRLTWCTMPTAGGTTRKFSKGLLAPAEELVTLAVALELDRHVAVHRVLPAEKVDLHRVVDHQVDRHQRVDLLRVAAEPPHGASHGRQIHHARHAGEVLQDHPGRLEGNFDRRPRPSRSSRPDWSRRARSRRSRRSFAARLPAGCGSSRAAARRWSAWHLPGAKGGRSPRCRCRCQKCHVHETDRKATFLSFPLRSNTGSSFRRNCHRPPSRQLYRARLR